MEADHLLAHYDFDLPDERIASSPSATRDASRLLVHDRGTGLRSHQPFHAIGQFLRSGDLLVANDARVIPARLFGTRATGGRVEILLDPTPPDSPPGAATSMFNGRALLRPSQKLRAGEDLTLENGCMLTVVDPPGSDLRAVSSPHPLASLLEGGALPLPPYLDRDGPVRDDLERYQTVFAERAGAVAAPTAGLHFTPELLTSLEAAGVGFTTLTLDVGPGTFLPVRAERLADHRMHDELVHIPAKTVERIESTKAAGGRVVAVGTTTTRAVEGCVAQRGRLEPGSLRVDLMIRPPYTFQVIDALITNFHLPRSTLLCLVSAFAGRETVLSLYAEAIEKNYRFYSYGDAMLLL